jgi:hypothetical protein
MQMEMMVSTTQFAMVFITHGSRPGNGTGGYQPDIFLGYCKSDGIQGYERMDFNWSVA